MSTPNPTPSHPTLDRCHRLGLRVKLMEPDRIRIYGEVPADLVAELKTHKPELLKILRQEQPAPAPRTHPSELPTTFEIMDRWPTRTGAPPPKQIVGGTLEEWRRTAGQVLDGEFAGADRGLRESLIIGLRGWNDPLCRRALALLQEADR